MIRYFCDVCGKEICGEWITRLTISADTISQYRGGGSRPNELHFHEECMSKMFKYLRTEMDGGEKRWMTNSNSTPPQENPRTEP